jgi:hypothetical protein
MQSPCLTTTSAEEWLEGLHFDTAEEALAVIRDAHVEADLVALAAPCWTVMCDGCGADLEDDEVHLLEVPPAESEETCRIQAGLSGEPIAEAAPGSRRAS